MVSFAALALSGRGVAGGGLVLTVCAVTIIAARLLLGGAADRFQAAAGAPLAGVLVALAGYGWAFAAMAALVLLAVSAVFVDPRGRRIALRLRSPRTDLQRRGRIGRSADASPCAAVADAVRA